MEGFILLQSEMVSGKLAPDFVFFDFSVAEAIVIGADIGLQSSHLPLTLLFPEKVIQNRRLRIGAPPPCFPLQERETLRGECERAPPLDIPITDHNIKHHTIGMTRWNQRV
jgi:hypothetical protein